MTQSELKELTNLGAELGAAKAEVARLREVLSRIANLPMYHCSTENDYRLSAAKAMAVASLSQRPDPTDTYTATDMATAAAQGFRDGQAAVEQDTAQDEQEVAAVIGFYEGEREPRLLSWNVLPNGEHRLYARPAQAEQQPVSWQFYQDGKWWNGDDRIKDHRKNTEAAGIPVRDLYAAPIAQTDPQPEQSGLVEAPPCPPNPKPDHQSGHQHR